MDADKLKELYRMVVNIYTKKTPKSRLLHNDACSYFPGGVPGNYRQFKPYPLFMVRGKGSRVYDIDGNEYIDCFLCNGPLLLGHCHPDVMEAVHREMKRGLQVHNPELSVECARLLTEIVPCADKVAFVNTGSEATMTAVRIARAYTKKDNIIKFYGHYHGQDDQFLVGFGNKNEQASQGIPTNLQKNTILMKCNDIVSLHERLETDNNIAAVILDPQGSRGGVFAPSHQYLKELRALTEERGVILIFDEVLSGFRLALGGAQEYFGITPDMATYSKGMASGGKLAAVVGKEEVMNVLIPNEQDEFCQEGKKVLQAGTYIDGTIALAAGIATLKTLKRLNEQGEYQRLHSRCDLFKTGIESAFRERNIPCHVNSIGPFFKIFLTEEPPDFDAYQNVDPRLLYLFFISLINDGVLLSWPTARSIYLSFAHTDKDINQIINTIHLCLDKYSFKNVAGTGG